MAAGVFTIIAKNYVAQARVLMASVRRFNPNLRRLVVLVDRLDGSFSPAGEQFELILSEDLDLPESQWFHFKYSLLELATAVKPYAFEYLFRRYGFDKLVYLDPDIEVHSELNSLLERLDHSTAILTPHLTDAIDDDKHPNELDILWTGVYNLGFIALSDCSEAERLLVWWKRKLYDQCLVDRPNGLFVDQRWMDLAPALFDGVEIARDSSCNVAFWNIATRPIERRDGSYFVDGRPLVFFHYSGYDPEKPRQFSRHQDRFRLADLGDAEGLVRAYGEKLIQAGYGRFRRAEWAYGRFDNGLFIPVVGRPIHREAPELISRVRNPFSDDGYRAFVDHWNQPASGVDASLGITRLVHKVYCERPEKRALMPEIFGRDRIRFLQWLVAEGGAEHGLHTVFLEQSIRAIEKTGGDSDERTESAGGRGNLKLPPRLRALHGSRPDLQRAFPDPGGRDGAGLLTWLLTCGQYEYDVDEESVRAARAEWDCATRQRGSLERMGRVLLLKARQVSTRTRLRRRVKRPAPSVQSPPRPAGSVSRL